MSEKTKKLPIKIFLKLQMMSCRDLYFFCLTNQLYSCQLMFCKQSTPVFWLEIVPTSHQKHLVLMQLKWHQKFPEHLVKTTQLLAANCPDVSSKWMMWMINPLSYNCKEGPLLHRGFSIVSSHFLPQPHREKWPALIGFWDRYTKDHKLYTSLTHQNLAKESCSSEVHFGGDYWIGQPRQPDDILNLVLKYGPCIGHGDRLAEGGWILAIVERLMSVFLRSAPPICP